MKKRFNVKDLVLIGILTLLIIIVSNIAGVLTMPLLSFALIASSGVSAFLTAPIYLLLAFKVAKRGTMLLQSLLRGILYSFMGFPHMFIILIPLGIISELIMIPAGTYRSIKRNTIAWSVFNAGYALHGVILLWIFGNQYFLKHMNNMFTGEQLALMNIYYYNPIIVVLIIATSVLLAAVGCWVGWRMLRKHFVKSGIIQTNIEGENI